MAPSLIEPQPGYKANHDVPDFVSLPERYGWPTTNENGYSIKEQPCGTERPIRILSLGAGVSGINLAYHVSRSLRDVKLTIYEKNDDIGGTWYENRSVIFPRTCYSCLLTISTAILALLVTSLPITIR